MTSVPPPDGLDPFTLLTGLTLDTDAAWGSSAVEFQSADARAVLDTSPGAPRLHFLTRPRGGSKTTDAAAMVLTALITQAPPRSTSHAFARDKDQAGRLVDVIGGLVARTGLSTFVEVGTWAVTVKGTGARLIVESADAGSAYGALPYFIVVDELAAWPTTRGARTLWEAIVSGLPKRADSRLLTITSAGDPAHWSAKILTAARRSSRWRVSETPGPLPWIDPDDLDEQRSLLPPSSFARLHLNQWIAAEDRLTSPEDLAAAVTLDGPLDPAPGVRYRIGLDLGVKHDRTVLTVCHAVTSPSDPSGPQRIVLDRIHVMQGTPVAPVQLGAVETLARDASRAYNRAPIRLDPWQGIGLAQRLRTSGVKVEEWSFTPVSVGRLAMTLFRLLRERRLDLPDDPALLEELAAVRLRETTPGVVRLDHDASGHDDRAVALGLAALALTEQPPVGRGGISIPRGTYTRPLSALRTSVPGREPVAPGSRRAALEARRAAARMPRGTRAILGVPGAYDDDLRR